MQIHDIVLSAAGRAGIDWPAETAASLYLPDNIAALDKVELLFCIHGGSYRRGYWHANFPGLHGYSFAEHLTKRGFVVGSIDLLGMGDSSRPPPPRELTRAVIMAASDLACRDMVAGLKEGRWARARHVSATGVGHSIGGMIAIGQQARHTTFDRVAVLGWSNLPVSLPPATVESLRAQCAQGGYVNPQGAAIRPFFYGDDVPEAVVAADEVLSSVTPACLIADAITDGIVRSDAGEITCPVFLSQATVDTSSNPHAEPGYFAKSDDVTLLMLRNTAHCHNLGQHRYKLWDRLADWVEQSPGAHGRSGLL